MKSIRHPVNGHKERCSKLKPAHPQGDFTQAAPDAPTVEACLPADPSAEDASYPVPSLSELSQLLRLEKYQTRRCRQLQKRLYRVHTVAARTTRLIHTARSVQRTLAECIRSEDKHSFVNLFNAFHDALSECSEQSKGLTEDNWTGSEAHTNSLPLFVDALPDRPRTTLLDFLTRLRHDANFVADRIASLTHKELIALLPEKGLSKSSDSVFGSSPRTSSRTSRHLGFVVDGQTELISSSDFGSPLDVLIHSVRGIRGRSLQDDNIATDVWATVCARLISDQKAGSEKLVPVVINAWASSCSWPGKSRLELWISQTLQNGSFLLEQPNRQSFRVRVQGRQEIPAEDGARQEAFYTEAVTSLLILLGDPSGASVIPEGARKMCAAICQKLQTAPGHQHAFPSFTITRWLFSSFLVDAILLPEASIILNLEPTTN